MLSPQQQHQLSRLRAFRARPTPDASLRDEMSRRAADLQRLASGLGPIAEAWNQVVPPALAGHATLVSIARGILTVRPSDAAAGFELSRFLRGGGEAELIRRSRIPIRRIKLTA